MNQLEFDFGIVAYSGYDDDGLLIVQHDSMGDQSKAGTVPSHALMPLNTYARPLDPDKGSDGSLGLGAAIMTIMTGSDRYVMPFIDPREVPKIPKVKKGGWMAAGGAGDVRSFVIIDGLDPNGVVRSGSIQSVAKYGTKAHSFVLNVRTDGNEDIQIIHGEGQRLVMSAGGGNPISLTSSNGQRYVKLDDSGLTLAAPVNIQGSLVVGETAAATPVASALAVVAAIEFLSEIVAGIGTAAAKAIGASDASASVALLSGLSSLTSAIAAKHLYTT